MNVIHDGTAAPSTLFTLIIVVFSPIGFTGLEYEAVDPFAPIVPVPIIADPP